MTITPFRTATPRRPVTAMVVALIVANLLLWLLAAATFRHYPVLLGTALLAYSFGLRHAVDGDHIAAIDNVTRKLMQAGQRPVGVGLFFSLGHSTIVFALSVAVAVAAVAARRRFGLLEGFGAVAGTLISAGFLIGIAIANIFILRVVLAAFRNVKAGAGHDPADLNLLLAQRGLFSRLFRRLFGLINQSWQMYPVGLLFGLGFDTATEVGLLGISAAEAAHGLPIWSIMLFPALFAAGMALVDTIDGVLMLGAYGWAFAKPIRKLYYNITITALSVLVALLVGGVELLGLAQSQLALTGPFWAAVAAVNNNFGLVGYGIIGLFLAGWLTSLLVYKIGRYDNIQLS